MRPACRSSRCTATATGGTPGSCCWGGCPHRSTQSAHPARARATPTAPPPATGPRTTPPTSRARMDAVELDAAVIVGHSGAAAPAPSASPSTTPSGRSESYWSAPSAPATTTPACSSSPLRSPSAQTGRRRFVREFHESTVAQAIPDGFLEAIFAESAQTAGARLEGLPPSDPLRALRLRAPTSSELYDSACASPANSPAPDNRAARRGGFSGRVPRRKRERTPGAAT
jgi:hypothetical protein